MNYPEMVKPNHRYRGPMESSKDNNAVRDIQKSLEIVIRAFDNNSANRKKIEGNMFSFYNEEIPNIRKEVVTGVTSVRGGEL